jgi:radical SAM protein with 4Fe4S-binding SPASM domain
MHEFLQMFADTFRIDEVPDINTISIAALHSSDGDYDFPEYLTGDEYISYPEIFVEFDNWNKLHTTELKHDFNNPDIGCPYNVNGDSAQCGLRIALDGSVFPCQLFSDPQFCIGNAYTDSIPDIISGERLAGFIDTVHSRKGNITECRGCGYRSLCLGGCPAQAYIENGTILSVSAKCTTRKSLLNTRLRALLHK